jgi:hypothetical protein
MQDRIVDEIRRIRQEHAKKLGYDLDAIFEDLKQKERKSKRKIVALKPRPAKSTISRK